MDLREFLTVIRARKWIVLVIALVWVTAGEVMVFRQVAVYRSSTRLEVQPVGAAPSDDALTAISAIGGMQTQVELIRSHVVARKVAEDLGFATPDEALAGLDVSNVEGTNIIEIGVRHVVPIQAQSRAASFAQAYVEFRREQALQAVTDAGEAVAQRMEQTREKIADADRQIAESGGRNNAIKSKRDALIAQLGALQAQLDSMPEGEQLRRGGGTVIVPANLPSSPVSAKSINVLAAAAVLGLAFGIGIALVWEHLDDRMRSKEDLEERAGVPVIGSIPRDKTINEQSVAALRGGDSSAVEAFRTLRTALLFLSGNEPPKTLVITSPREGEGKTTTVANLGVVFAQQGVTTVIVSADLRRPSLHRAFSLTGARGLSDVLMGRAKLEDCVVPIGSSRLSVLPSGSPPSSPAELVASERMSKTIDELRSFAEIVIIDAPPVLGMADALALSAQAEATLLVVETSMARGRLVAHGVEELRRVGANILGIVASKVEEGESYYYPYYRYYSSRYRAPRTTAEWER